MSDPFQLERFLEAQKSSYQDVVAELQAGRKTSHWIWYIFPQLKGLGHSWMADKYGIGSRAEARAYLAEPTLGRRLIECVRLVCQAPNASIVQILGRPDDMKFRSSMTLFALIQTDCDVYRKALDQFFDGQHDVLTERLLAKMP